ncbi:hypothetical protein [Rubellimicrobium mesophilum]|nr:hypothetical protein [Rubellimicrobium mesophilum]
MVRLTGIEFWPKWPGAAPLLGGTYVEPDVVLRFEVGEPAEPYTIIVEAKYERGGEGGQYGEQWAREWIACGAEPDEASRHRVLLAVGGLLGSREVTVDRLTPAIGRMKQTLGVPGDEEILTCAAGWADILAVVAEDARTEADLGRRLVLEDIVEGLGLHGYLRLLMFDDLLPLFEALNGDFERSLRAIGRLDGAGAAMPAGPPDLPTLGPPASMMSFSGLDRLLPLTAGPGDFPRLETSSCLPIPDVPQP